MSIKIKALKIKGTNKVLHRPESVPHCDYLLNGEPIERARLLDKPVVFDLVSDEIAVKDRKIIAYKKGDESMTPGEFKSKPQGFSEDSSDAEILSAMKNRSELKGYEPVYSDESIAVEFEIVGEIADTKSDFITCAVGAKYENHGVLFYLDRSAIEVDAYLKMADKYAKHATFGHPERGCLQYIDINGKLTFCDDCYSLRKLEAHVGLASAQEAEKKYRENVDKIIKNIIFKEVLTLVKATKILAKLEVAQGLEVVSSKDLVLGEIIGDLKEYLSINSKG